MIRDERGETMSEYSTRKKIIFSKIKWVHVSETNLLVRYPKPSERMSPLHKTLTMKDWESIWHYYGVSGSVEVLTQCECPCAI